MHSSLSNRITNVRHESKTGHIAVLLKTNDKRSKHLTIINIHAPTAEKAEQEHDAFHEELDQVYRKYRNDHSSFICGDFNAEEGARYSLDTCMGSHTIGHTRSEAGERLIDFCERHKLFICNTAFEQPKRAMMTHYATNKNGDIYYRQIDYIICRRELKGMLSNCRTYGKSVNSDHRLLVARVELPRYYGLVGVENKAKGDRQTHRTVQYDVERLKDPIVQQQYRATLLSNLVIMNETESNMGKTLWANVVESIKSAAKSTIGVKSRDLKKKAFQDDLLNEWSKEQQKIRMDILSCKNKERRREMKTERNRLLKSMRRRVRNLRMLMIQEKVAVIDQCKDSAKQFEAIRIVRDLGKTRQKLVVHNTDGERIMDDTEAAEYVRAHFVTQFSNVNKPPLEPHPPNPQPLSYPILPSEVDKAIRKLKNRRAVGLDGLCAELLKNAPPEIHSIIAYVLKKAIAKREDLELGLAVLVTLQQPGKPAGPEKIKRPIALIPLRKFSFL